jgi:MFS family permease
MQFLVLGWLVLDLTDSSSQLGLVVFLYGVPYFGLLLVGGLIADRIDRRTLVLTTQASASVVVLLLATAIVADRVTIAHVYIVALVLGGLQGMELPGRMAIVSDLVSRADIMNAVALNSAVMSIGRIVGPAVAGFVIDEVGLGASAFLNGSCYLMSFAILLLVSTRPRSRPEQGTSILRELLEGLRYFRATPVVFTVIGIGYAYGLFASPYQQVMPAFAKSVLEADASGVGLLIAAVGIGSLLGNIALASLGDFRYRNRLMMGALVLFGVALMAFAWSPWFWASWLILLLVGMGSVTYVSLGTTVLQLTVPSELLGRVMSLWTIGAAFVYVGALPMGVTADLSTWPIAVSAGAGLFTLVALWLGVWRPTLRRMSDAATD